MNKFRPRNKICFQNNENIHANLKISKLNKKKWNLFKKRLKYKKEIKPEKRNKFFQKRLFEKQQFKNFYGCIPEYQLKNLFSNLNKKDNKINTFKNFILILESRLDINLVRLKLAKTVFQSKQLINHKKVKINNKIVSKPNFLLKKGDVATVSIDAYPVETFKGIINKIAEAADPASGTYEVEVKVLPNGQKFAAGLFANIQLNTSATQKVALIPIEAFTEGNGKSGYVYLLNNDKRTVTKRKVEIAFVTDDKIAIKSGLDNVSSVITDGVSYLTEDAVVKAPSP